VRSVGQNDGQCATKRKYCGVKRDRLTIRNNVFTEKGMISGDRAGILSPMLPNAVEATRACPFPMSSPASFRILRGLTVAAAASVLAACSTASDVAATSNPNVFTVTTRTLGVSTSWADAHAKAVSEATNYCEQRGMRVSMKQESLTGGRRVDARSELSFECHPTFETASNPRG
jgi:putative hemolysin